MTTPPRSILIVRLSAIGDVIHALPVLDALRAQLPKARIGWVVEELSAPLLQHHPFIDKLYVIPKKRWRKRRLRYLFPEIIPFYRSIRRDRWEVALDLQGLTKSSFLAFISGARVRAGFASGRSSREISPLLNNRRVEVRSSERHVVEHNLRLLEGIGLSVPVPGPRGTLGILDEEKEAMSESLRKAGWRGEALMALNPGAGWVTKRWSPAYYAEVGRKIAKRFGYRPLVLWGPGEETIRDAILECLDDTEAIAAPPTRVRELAVLISLCSLFIGGDTGASHLAGLLNVPVLSIFGASDPVRNCPWPHDGPQAAGMAIQLRELSCVPCWKEHCPLKGDAHLACLRELTPGRVMEGAEEWLSTVSRSR